MTYNILVCAQDLAVRTYKLCIVGGSYYITNSMGYMLAQCTKTDIANLFDDKPFIYYSSFDNMFCVCVLDTDNTEVRVNLIELYKTYNFPNGSDKEKIAIEYAKAHQIQY